MSESLYAGMLKDFISDEGPAQRAVGAHHGRGTQIDK